MADNMFMESNLTREQAIEIASTNWWKSLTPEDIVIFQLFEERICMPFDEFHEAVEKCLNRPVFTHEFAYPGALQEEFLGTKSAPTFGEILELIPEVKRIIVVT